MSDLSRRSFLGVAAAGCCSTLLMGGCSNGGSTDGSVTPTNGVAVLPFTSYPKLQTMGEGVVVAVGSQRLAVIRTGASSATALSAVCTHEGCIVEVGSNNAPLYCPCHGSEFALTGAVLQGPANTPLQVFTATVDATGVQVKLT